MLWKCILWKLLLLKGQLYTFSLSVNYVNGSSEGYFFFLHYSKDSPSSRRAKLGKIQRNFTLQDRNLAVDALACTEKKWSEWKENWIPLKNRGNKRVGKCITMNTGNRIKVWGFRQQTHAAGNKPFKFSLLLWACCLINLKQRNEMFSL